MKALIAFIILVLALIFGAADFGSVAIKTHRSALLDAE